jgi:1,2-diacylglycerol 3-alpha-glucosyltransferase
MKRKESLNQWFIEWKKEILKHWLMIIISIIIFGFSIVINYISGVYVTYKAECVVVPDLILKYFGPYDFNIIYIWGFIIASCLLIIYPLIYNVKKTHIAFFHFSFLTAVRALFITLTHLQTPTDAIEVIYPNDPKNDEFNGFKTYRFFSINVPYFQKRFRVFLVSPKELKKIFLKEKIDVVHTIMLTFSVLSSINAAKKIGIKVISHPHSQPENLINNFPKILQNKNLISFVYNIMIKIAKKADIVICPTKFAEEELKKRNFLLNTIVVSNGVNLSRYHKKVDTISFIKKNNLKKEEIKIICVSRLNPEKSVETLIKSIPIVLKEYKKVHFYIVGLGHQEKFLKNLSQSINVEKNLTFLGRLSDEELIKAYNASDIFVHPSLAELEGMVVLEAMACGKPIIISDSKESASRFFVEDNGFLFKSKDPKDLADKILILLKNKKLMEKMGKNSLENVKQYDINKSVSELEKIYYSLVKNNQ